jgi:23S rRNA pseudouridine1911/1915/1917 synthase
MKYDLEYTVKAADAGMTARGVASRRLGVSKRLIRKIANAAGSGDGEAFAGGVFIGGRPAFFTDRVQEGDVVGLAYPEERSDFIPQDIPIDALYEDDDILVLNKQPGVVVHPTKGHADGTIANGLMRRMAFGEERYKIRFANRLDMDTSGALIVVKNARAQSEFARQSEAGGIKKLYLAALDGVPPAERGYVDEPIALEREGAPRRVAREDGAPSHTFYRIIERYSYRPSRSPAGGGERGDAACAAPGRGAAGTTGDDGVGSVSGAGVGSGERRAALALISITTGRTHQIRVHMAHIGCPVLGDTLYGTRAPSLPDDRGEADAPLIGRQALHAAVLRFAHPRTRAELTFRAPLPDDMVHCLRRLRAATR